MLVVDDDEDLAMTIQDAIASMGQRAVWARDGREALAALESERPLLVLVDMFMPVMSGAELLGVLRSSRAWADIPRVIMTAANDPMIGVKEDTAVLYKPIDLDALTQVVRRFCG